MPKKVLSSFTVSMIAISAIVSLRNLPLTANYGLGSIFFYLVAGLAFLLPTAFVAAELATTWPKTGGIYVWVSEAFGEKYGFLAVWLEWVMNMVWNPTALSFIAATLAYIINPALVENKWFMVSVMLIVFWGATLLNCRGMKTSGWISSIGVLVGTIAPALILIVLAAIWLIIGNPSQISFSLDTFIPSMQLDNLVFFSAVLLGLAGMEVAAFHASEVKNPQKEYPKAIMRATVVILLLFILGTLSIAIVVPAEKISLVAGLMQAIDIFLGFFHMNIATKLFGAIVMLGALAMISTWIAGPSHGLLATARNGDLPPFFKKTNRAGMPIHVLITQGCISSMLILVFLFLPNINASYWILTDLTAQLTTLIYLLLFSSAIRLRYTQSKKKRPFKIPGGNLGMWLVAGTGILAALCALFIGFVPPKQLEIGNRVFYECFLLFGILILGIPPFIFAKLKHTWRKQ